MGTMTAAGSVKLGRLVTLVALASVTLAAQEVTGESFLVTDMEGKQYDVGAILAAGRPVVFVFWQTWCPSCKREAPELADAVDHYGEQLQFFGVVSGPDEDIDDDDVRAVASNWGHRHPQVRDRDLALAKRFEVTGTPVIVVLGNEGRVLYRGYRLPHDWSDYIQQSAPSAGTPS